MNIPRAHYDLAIDIINVTKESARLRLLDKNDALTKLYYMQGSSLELDEKIYEAMAQIKDYPD